MKRAAPIAQWPEPSDTSVFAVDDDPAFLRVLVQFLEAKGYEVTAFESSQEAEKAIRADCPDLLITDLLMPEPDGLALARIALEEDPDLPVVVLTGAGDVSSAAEGLRIGLADYLLKPMDFLTLERTVWRSLLQRTQVDFHRESEAWMREELEARTQDAIRKAQQLEDVTVGAFSALMGALEGRTPHFKGHSKAVATLSEAVATGCRLPQKEVNLIQAAAFVHDIGMIGVPDQLLDKPSDLTPEETKKVQEHCVIGAGILRPFTHLGPLSEYVLHHHERADGSGYPNRLIGDDIPLGAQVIGVAEMYCAMTEARPHRPPMTPGAALGKIVEARDRWFSGQVTDALEAALSSVLGND